MDVQTSLLAKKGEVVCYGNTAMVKENVVVRTQTQDIIGRVRTIVGSA